MDQLSNSAGNNCRKNGNAHNAILGAHKLFHHGNEVHIKTLANGRQHAFPMPAMYLSATCRTPPL
jgi:hypothetical protein